MYDQQLIVCFTSIGFALTVYAIIKLLLSKKLRYSLASKLGARADILVEDYVSAMR